MNNGMFWDKGIMLVTGCKKVSLGCANCWSEKQHAIRSRQKNEKMRKLYNSELLSDGKFNGKVQFNLYLLKKAAKVRKPHVYAIWNDLYHEGITDYDRDLAIEYMFEAEHHTWIIVTKRPENAVRFHLEHPVSEGQSFPENIWHIVTAENQEMADKRIPHLLRIPGKRGLLLESMLGPVDLTNHRVCDQCGGAPYNPYLPEDWRWSDWKCLRHYDPYGGCDGTLHHDIHQVILGGETGHGARPINPEWVRSVRDQCEAAGVPFYFKGWGQYKGPSDWKIPADRILDGREHNDLAWRTNH
jgi:protein gp37